jgi:hypothetical protein
MTVLMDIGTFFSSRSFFPAAAAVSLVVAVAAAAEPLLTPLPLHNRIVKNTASISLGTNLVISLWSGHFLSS